MDPLESILMDKDSDNDADVDAYWELLEEFAQMATSDSSSSSSSSLANDKQKENGDDVCESCGAKELIVEDGQYICKKCNVIQDIFIDNGAEWRYYGVDDNRDEDPTRCGMPTNSLLPKSSLGSMVGGRRNDSKDNRRIRMYQMWNSMPHGERSLYQVFETFSNNTVNQGIPAKVLNDAKVLYKMASEKKISRGNNKEGLIASCIYYACAINKVPRSTKEIAKMFRIDSNILTKGNARFQSLLQINVECESPEDYITPFGNKLCMNWEDIQQCKVLTGIIDSLEIVSENAPTSVAAGSLYYYCMMANIEHSKRQLSDICAVSEVTITKCYKKILKYKDLLHQRCPIRNVKNSS